MKFMKFMKTTVTYTLLAFFLCSMLTQSEAICSENDSGYDSYTYRKISSLNRQIKRTKSSIKKAKRKNQRQKRNRLTRKLRKQKIVLRDYEGRTILGRWIPDENSLALVRYVFRDGIRVTLYRGDDESFPSLAEALQNPSLVKDWHYEGRTVVVDLNFGNYQRLIPQFSSNNRVITWFFENGTLHSTISREG